MMPTKEHAERTTSYAMDVVVCDTETTGFKVPEGHRLIEIATVHVLRGKIVRDWSALVNPSRLIPPDATKVHGITDAEVALADMPAVVAPIVSAALRCEGAVVFHNSPFDLPFVNQLLADGGQPPFDGPVVDTLGLARGIYGVSGNSLGALVAKLGLPAETAHRALGDARMTARLLLTLASWYEEQRGIVTLTDLAAYSLDVMRRTTFARR